MRIRLASFFVLLWMVAAPFADAGQLVVIDSTVPELKPGQMIDGSKPFSLAAGGKVTLISESGKVVALSGPFSGAPDAGGAAAGGGNLMASLSQLMGGGSTQSSSLGVMRAVKAGEAPDVWVVDVIRSGDHCVRADKAPVLWRPSGKKKATLTIKPLPRGKRVSVDWPVGIDGLDWPENLALEDGGRYLVRVSGRMTATKLVLHMVPGNLASDAHRAVWMADKGCVGQAKALLASLR